MIPADARIQMEVPRSVVFGRQLTQEYRPASERLVKRALQEQGYQFLLQNPVFLVALQTVPHACQLVLIDGHHRTRYAPVYGIHTLPAEIATVESLAAAVGVEVGILIQGLITSMAEAGDSFGKRGYSVQGSTLSTSEKIKDVQSLRQVLNEAFQSRAHLSK